MSFTIAAPARPHVTQPHNCGEAAEGLDLDLDLDPQSLRLHLPRSRSVTGTWPVIPTLI